MRLGLSPHRLHKLLGCAEVARPLLEPGVHDVAAFKDAPQTVGHRLPSLEAHEGSHVSNADADGPERTHECERVKN